MNYNHSLTGEIVGISTSNLGDKGLPRLWIGVIKGVDENENTVDIQMITPILVYQEIYTFKLKSEELTVVTESEVVTAYVEVLIAILDGKLKI